MEKFLSLPVEKQSSIIDAALTVFGTNGYKKASISDIATAAGISKSMVFHYFGTKKELYLYLVNYCGNLLVKEVFEKLDNSINDFFDRIMMASKIELAVMIKNPGASSFLKSMYFEENEEIKDDIKALLAQSDIPRNKLALDSIDTSKFKEGVDLKLVMKILMWMTDGFMNTLKEMPEQSFETLGNEFFDCMKLMRKYFYKEG